ncbi:MAG: hypothetical protein ACHQ50_16080 [Fimbriimonadales bacterium]
MEDAEIYVEFAYLRDWWSGLLAHHGGKKKANVEKHEFIRKGIASFPQLRGVAAALPVVDEPSEFNRKFMGESGARIKKDIVYPGRWSVKAIDENFEGTEFQYLCWFKWAFNIKPDLVIVLAGQPPLVVEAKLLSPEAQYPTGSECKIFDKKELGPDKGRVGQFELQRIMFDHLLQTPCRSVVLKRDALPDGHNCVITWKDVFDRMDVGDSIPFVKRLISNPSLTIQAGGIAGKPPRLVVPLPSWP